MEIPREAAVVLGHLRTGTTTAGVTQEREIRSAWKPDRVIEHRELAELHEVVSAAARAQLRPRAILQPGGDAA